MSFSMQSQALPYFYAPNGEHDGCLDVASDNDTGYCKSGSDEKSEKSSVVQSMCKSDSTASSSMKTSTNGPKWFESQLKSTKNINDALGNSTLDWFTEQTNTSFTNLVPLGEQTTECASETDSCPFNKGEGRTTISIFGSPELDALSVCGDYNFGEVGQKLSLPLATSRAFEVNANNHSSLAPPWSIVQSEKVDVTTGQRNSGMRSDILNYSLGLSALVDVKNDPHTNSTKVKEEPRAEENKTGNSAEFEEEKEKKDNDNHDDDSNNEDGDDNDDSIKGNGADGMVSSSIANGSSRLNSFCSYMGAKMQEPSMEKDSALMWEDASSLLPVEHPTEAKTTGPETSPNKNRKFLELGGMELMPELSKSFVDGCNVVMLFPGTESRATTPPITPTWSPINNFILAVAGKLKTEFSLYMSLVVIKHDQMRDLVPHSASSAETRCYKTLSVDISPIYGPCLRDANYVDVSDTTKTSTLFSEAFLRTTVDDQRRGLVVISIILRQTVKNGRDIIVSSALGVSATARTLHFTFRTKHPPLTASFLRVALCSSRMCEPFVYGGESGSTHFTPEEVLIVCEIQQAFRSWSSKRPQNSSAVCAPPLSAKRSFLSFVKKEMQRLNSNNTKKVESTSVAGHEEKKLSRGYLGYFKKLMGGIPRALHIPISQMPLTVPMAMSRKILPDVCISPQDGATRRGRRGKSSKRSREKRTDHPMRKLIECEWTIETPMVNLLAGEMEMPLGGIRPLFTEWQRHKRKRTDVWGKSRVCGLVMIEDVSDGSKPSGKARSYVTITRDKCVAAEAPTGEISKFKIDEACIEPVESPPQFLTRAFDLFVKGYNTAILLMRDRSCRKQNIMNSPTWLFLLSFFKMVMETPVPGREFYVSVVQVVSRDSVLDYLDNGLPQPFRVAWTPAGPVVEGARFQPMRSAKELNDILAALYKSVVDCTGNSSTVHSFHIVMSIMMKTITESDVQLSTLTITAVSSPEAYTSLCVDESVPMEHSKNIYRCALRHYTVCVADVSSTSSTSLPILQTLQLLTRHTRHPHSHTPWTLRYMLQYLADHCALYEEELSSRLRNCSDEAPSTERRELILSFPIVANWESIAMAWCLTERMRSATAATLVDVSAWAVGIDCTYNIMSPLLQSLNDPDAFPLFEEEDMVDGVAKKPSMKKCMNENGKNGSRSAPNTPANGKRNNKLGMNASEGQQGQYQLPRNSKLPIRCPQNEASDTQVQEKKHIPHTQQLPKDRQRGCSATSQRQQQQQQEEEEEEELLHRDELQSQQTTQSKRLDKFLERVVAVCDESMSKPVAGKETSVQMTVVLVLSTSQESLPTPRLMESNTKSIRVGNDEVPIVAVDTLSNVNAMSLKPPDMPISMKKLGDMIGKFLHGRNTTLLMAEPFTKPCVMLRALLSVARGAMLSKKSNVHICMSLVIVHSDHLVYDLMSTTPDVSLKLEVIAQNSITGPILRNAIWRDVKTEDQMENIQSQAISNLDSVFEKIVDAHEALIMMSIIARRIEENDVVLSSLVAFSVGNSVAQYNCLLPRQCDNADTRETVNSRDNLIRYAVKIRPSFAYSFFLLDDNMPLMDAQRFLLAMKVFMGCELESPAKGSVAEMMKQRKEVKLHGSTNPVVMSKTANILEVLANTNMLDMPLSPLPQQPSSALALGHGEASSVSLFTQAFLDACDGSSLTRTVVLLSSCGKESLPAQGHTVTISGRIKRQVQVSEVVSVLDRELQRRQGGNSMELQVAARHFIGGNGVLILMGCTTKGNRLTSHMLQTLVGHALVELKLKHQKHTNAKSVLLTMSCLHVRVEGALHGLDLLHDPPVRVEGDEVLKVINNEFDLSTCYAVPIEKNFRLVHDKMEERREELLALEGSNASFVVYNFRLVHSPSVPNESNTHPKQPEKCVLRVVNVSNVMLAWAKEAKRSVARKRSQKKDRNISTVVCVGADISDPPQEFADLVEFQEYLTKQVAS